RSLRAARVEDDPRDEARVVELRRRRDAVLQGELQRGAHALGDHALLGLFAELPGLLVAAALRAGERARRLRRPVGLRRLRRALGLELVLDLADGLVEERPGPEHDLARLRPREPRARPVRPAARRLALRHVAREAALEGEHAEQVRGERRLGQRLADEDVDGVVAEALVQALRPGAAGAPPA